MPHVASPISPRRLDRYLITRVGAGDDIDFISSAAISADEHHGAFRARDGRRHPGQNADRRRLINGVSLIINGTRPAIGLIHFMRKSSILNNYVSSLASRKRQMMGDS